MGHWYVGGACFFDASKEFMEKWKPSLSIGNSIVYQYKSEKKNKKSNEGK